MTALEGFSLNIPVDRYAHRNKTGGFESVWQNRLDKLQRRLTPVISDACRELKPFSPVDVDFGYGIKVRYSIYFPSPEEKTEEQEIAWLRGELLDKPAPNAYATWIFPEQPCDIVAGGKLTFEIGARSAIAVVTWLLWIRLGEYYSEGETRSE